MRQIKFRFWDTNTQKMYEVGNIVFNVKHGMGASDTATYVDSPDGSRYRVIGRDSELMQFTGLLDGDEREIYEGDIVKYCVHDARENARVGVVTYLHGSFMLDPYGAMHLSTGMYKEVIGNIYEHPHLLK